MEFEEVRHALANNYEAADEAFQAKDIGRIADLMSPDFDGSSIDGKTVSRDQVLEDVMEQFQQSESITFHREIKDLSVDGDTAKATVEGDFRVRRSDGTLIEQWLRNEDVWQKGPAAWVMVQSRTLSAH